MASHFIAGRIGSRTSSPSGLLHGLVSDSLKQLLVNVYMPNEENDGKTEEFADHYT